MEKIFIGGIMNIAQCVNSPGGSILRSVEYPTLFPLCLLLTLFAAHLFARVMAASTWLYSIPISLESYLNHFEAQFRNDHGIPLRLTLLSISMALVPSPWKRALNVQAVSLKLLRNFYWPGSTSRCLQHVSENICSRYLSFELWLEKAMRPFQYSNTM